MTPTEIGRANAESAVDQRADYDDSLASFYENMLDTLGEHRLTTDRDINEAHRAFMAVCTANGLTSRHYR